jgi:hypothetical protein
MGYAKDSSDPRLREDKVVGFWLLVLWVEMTRKGCCSEEHTSSSFHPPGDLGIETSTPAWRFGGSWPDNKRPAIDGKNNWFYKKNKPRSVPSMAGVRFFRP